MRDIHIFNRGYIKLEIEEICNKYNSDRNHGLAENQINILREKYGSNSILGSQTVALFDDNLFICCFCGVLIICIIGLVHAFSIYLLIFILLLCSICIMFAWCDLHIFTAAFRRSHKFTVYRGCTVSVIRQQFEKMRVFVPLYVGNNCMDHHIYSNIINLIIKYIYSQTVKIHPDELVSGDIVLLKKGDIVPADIRLIECNEFIVNIGNNEYPKPYIGATDIGATDMVYCGSTIISGKAKGIVVYTGFHVECEQYLPRLTGPDRRKSPHYWAWPRYHYAIRNCQYISCAMFCVLIIVFVVFSYILSDIKFSINSLWGIIGIVFVIIFFFAVAWIWKSGENFKNKLKNECNLLINHDVCYEEEISKIQILIIDIRYVSKNILLLINYMMDMNITLIILSDFDISKMKILTDILSNKLNVSCIQNGIHLSNINQFTESVLKYDVVFTINFKTDDIIKCLNKHFFICYVGNQSVEIYKLSDLSIAINENGSNVIKQKADIICCCSLIDDYLDSIIKSIKISRQFCKSYGYKLTNLIRICFCCIWCDRDDAKRSKLLNYEPPLMFTRTYRI